MGELRCRYGIESPGDAPEHDARTALLEAVETLILSDGYAAVTSRRVAAEAGVNPGLVYYYFGPMDNLFVEVFRRSAARVLDRQAQRWKPSSRCGRSGT